MTSCGAAPGPAACLVLAAAGGPGPTLSGLGGHASLPDAFPSVPSTGPGFGIMLVITVLAAAGAWLWWRGRRQQAGPWAKGERRLAIAESRSLGNRQYLVVAAYDDRKFLLGVCPGRIDLLSPLDEAGKPPASR